MFNKIDAICTEILNGQPIDSKIDIRINEHQNSNWISVERDSRFVNLSTLSEKLNTEIISICYLDEFILQFNYIHLSSGKIVRQICFSEDNKTSDNVLKINDGNKEIWEPEPFTYDMEVMLSTIVQYFQLPYNRQTTCDFPVLRTKSYHKPRSSWLDSLRRKILAMLNQIRHS
jgi:hypothetical protein